VILAEGNHMSRVPSDSDTHLELCHPSDQEWRSVSDDCHQTWRYDGRITGAYAEERRACF
jgi:hypothetical protein